ncbi:hypothetical protein ACFLWM_02610 [Chloroflexota bacterium]
MFNCLICGTEVKRDDRYCRNCAVDLSQFRSLEYYRNRWHYTAVRLLNGFTNISHRIYREPLEEDPIIRSKQVEKLQVSGKPIINYSIERTKVSWSDFEFDLQREIIADCIDRLERIKNKINNPPKNLGTVLQDIELASRQLEYLHNWATKYGAYGFLAKSTGYFNRLLLRMPKTALENKPKVHNNLKKALPKIIKTKKDLEKQLEELYKQLIS